MEETRAYDDETRVYDVDTLAIKRRKPLKTIALEIAYIAMKNADSFLRSLLDLPYFAAPIVSMATMVIVLFSAPYIPPAGLISMIASTSSPLTATAIILPILVSDMSLWGKAFVTLGVIAGLYYRYRILGKIGLK